MGSLRYKLGNEPFWLSGPLGPGKLLPPSTDREPSFVDLPDDVLPSHTWEGTDDKSRAAVAIAKDINIRKMKQAARIETLARMNQQQKENDPLLQPIEIPAPFNAPKVYAEPPASAPVVDVVPQPSTPSEAAAQHMKRGKRAADMDALGGG